ncbi:hypothetical protein SDRG_03247 [Saprolegnia diclina VS20]|uniref:Uncharacterized protein n=1 Tax=Saprolegnia diclina (strain VS20) TaxID=1156394 RepID=T0SAI7_SAPDV|nr:hypothetical protein SDRG_03247 [Saprolegnia diclina VS20]EQC39827.1 hypothetical protein SDRG_03247 [Saprolegnia diclina VS20]|eukprot:XP_008607099.1 hypothetical protein SDRG_03247 [Saprolegnia diclina VS20]
MLPLYKRGLHLVTLAKSRRHRRYATFAVVSAILICILMLAMYAMYIALSVAENDVTPQPSLQVHGPEIDAGLVATAISKTPVPTTITSPIGGDDDTKPPPPAVERFWLVRLVLPLVAGFVFGFLGSIPIAGPTSAMVLKMGIQGEYWAAQSIALGGAAAEATYAGVAFWGFGSFLAGLDFLLPLSKVLGAIMLLAIGTYFLRLDVRPQIDTDPDVHTKVHHDRSFLTSPVARAELIKNILMGFTMSGFNPALLATYTGALASVYHTGLLEFTLFLAIVFGVGVSCGISTWFYVLLSLLKKYKQRLKNQTIGLILRCMGVFMICLGLLCTKSAAVYFLFS